MKHHEALIQDGEVNHQPAFFPRCECGWHSTDYVTFTEGDQRSADDAWIEAKRYADEHVDDETGTGRPPDGWDIADERQAYEADLRGGL